MSTSFRAGTVSSCDVSAAKPGTRLQSPVGLQHFLFFIANVKLPAIPTDGGRPVEASSLLGGLWSQQESLIAISLLLRPCRAVSVPWAFAKDVVHLGEACDVGNAVPTEGSLSCRHC